MIPFAWSCFAAISLLFTIAASGVEGPTGVTIVSEYWATRQGTSSRVLMMRPRKPRGGVMLLPGGHGNINLDVQAQIGWGQDDFLIRTRAKYPQAEFAAVVPDIAVDRKPPAKLGDYRRSEAQAADLGSIADHLRGLVQTVFVVAYDQGATSALNAIARGKLGMISGLVLISPIMESGEPSATVLQNGARHAFAGIPVLMISHVEDACSVGAAKDLNKIANTVKARNFQAVSVTGGKNKYQLWDPLAYYHDPCNKEASHAMAGLEEDVSTIIVDWLEKLVSERS